MSTADIDLVCCTGGTAPVAALATGIQQRFGAERLVRLRSLQSVIQGLGERARAFARRPATLGRETPCAGATGTPRASLAGMSTPNSARSAARVVVFALGTASLCACTTLGPTPAMTGIAAPPLARPGVELQIAA